MWPVKKSVENISANHLALSFGSDADGIGPIEVRSVESDESASIHSPTESYLGTFRRPFFTTGPTTPTVTTPCSRVFLLTGR